jgi:photosystem II stability/assembly factor-like uncharacterized protein
MIRTAELFRKQVASRAATAILAVCMTSVTQAQAPPAAPAFKGIWEGVNYSEDISLTDVFFVTPETGYVAGAAGTILKTTDAGASWTPQLGGDPESEERAITQLWFVTPTTGWATQVTGTHTNLLRTTDGETWGRVGTIAEHFDDLAFSSENEGLYINNEQIFRTLDGGKTWGEVYKCETKAEVGGLTRLLQCNLWKLHFASPSVVYALGQAKDARAAMVLKSVDGGDVWSVVSVLDDESGTEGGLFFIDENNGYLSTHYSLAAYRTTDGGLTWTGMPATTTGRRILFADPEVGWAIQNGKLSYTTDGGRRWASRTLAFPAMPRAFSLPRRDMAYAVGDHGMIYRYRIVPAATPLPAKALAAPAMPGLENALLAQITTLERRLDGITTVVEGAEGGTVASASAEGADASAGEAGTTNSPSGGSAGSAIGEAAWGDSAAVQQEIVQLQSTVDAVAVGAPQLGRKHRNLNMVMLGLKLLGDLTGQGSGLKQAFVSLRQAKSADSASAALTNLHTQLSSLKTSVEAFKTAKVTGY